MPRLLTMLPPIIFCAKKSHPAPAGEDFSRGGGIRTPGTRQSSAVFKTAGFNHSPTPPGMAQCPTETETGPQSAGYVSGRSRVNSMAAGGGTLAAWPVEALPDCAGGAPPCLEVPLKIQPGDGLGDATGLALPLHFNGDLAHHLQPPGHLAHLLEHRAAAHLGVHLHRRGKAHPV